MTLAIRLGIQLLAGPVIWITHFMVVYLLAEVACEFGLLTDTLLGLPVLSWVVLAATALAIGAIVPFLAKSEALRNSADSASRLAGFGGVLLDWLSIFAIAFVGLPAAALTPC